jgi:hypothetical protein
MRKTVDVLLVLVLFGAVAYLFFVLGDDVGGVWFSTPTPTMPSTQPAKPTATVSTAVVQIPTQTGTLTATSRPTLTLTATPTYTATPTATFTSTPSPSLTPTVDAAQAALEEEINGGIERGNQIVEAIENYFQAEGHYPAGLDGLVPDYLPEIPTTDAGQQFFYRLFDATSLMAPEVYWVAFNVTRRDHVSCTYLRRLDYWDCNFASP